MAKPLHVGHMRTAIVGESIKRIIKFMGHNVVCDIHLGDYGLQIGQVIYGLKQENIPIENIDINILNTIYPKISGLCKENEDVKNICATITKKLQDGNEEYHKYFERILEVSKKDMIIWMSILIYGKVRVMLTSILIVLKINFLRKIWLELVKEH